VYRYILRDVTGKLAMSTRVFVGTGQVIAISGTLDDLVPANGTLSSMSLATDADIQTQGDNGLSAIVSLQKNTKGMQEKPNNWK
jgi:hypothetical protein